MRHVEGAMRKCAATDLIRKPVNVPLDLLDQAACLHPIGLCEIFIEHHVALAKIRDPGREPFALVGSSRDGLARTIAEVASPTSVRVPT